MALPLVTQAELVDELAERTGWSKSDVRGFLVHLQSLITETVENGNRIKVASVVVEPRVKKATKERMGRNPSNGEEVLIPAKPASVKLTAKIVKPLADAALPSAKRLRMRQAA